MQIVRLEIEWPSALRKWGQTSFPSWREMVVVSGGADEALGGGTIQPGRLGAKREATNPGEEKKREEKRSVACAGAGGSGVLGDSRLHHSLLGELRCGRWSGDVPREMDELISQDGTV